MTANIAASDIVAQVPGCATSADQDWRLADLANDFREDVVPLDEASIQRIVQVFAAHGAQEKVSSIHVNGWFGEYDKLAMTRRFFAEVWHQELDTERERVVFSGDSPNDAPLFAYFPNAVGVANVMDFRSRLPAAPHWVTQAAGGAGFAELVEALLAVRSLG